MNWMSILGLCLIILGTVFSFFGTYLSDKKGQEELTTKIQEKNKTIDDINSNNIRLIDQNSSLLNSNQKVSSSNQDLINQNSAMLSKIDKYQSDIEDRNRRIQKLESEIQNVKEYSFYSKLDIYGREFTVSNGLTGSTSDLTSRMTKVVTSSAGKVYIKNDKENLKIIDEVIEKYPKFPFGYFAKFNILQALNDPEWKVFAAKAVDIFEITTSIEGHNATHDEALAILKRALLTN